MNWVSSPGVPWGHAGGLLKSEEIELPESVAAALLERAM